ncbi:MAG: HAD family hydrolase, partial [Planctomycetia bacterium]
AGDAPFDAVVFDMDGTMFDTERLYFAAGEELLGRRGLSFTAELQHRMMGRPAAAALGELRDHHALDDSIDELRRESSVIFDSLLDGNLRMMPGLLDALRRIDRAGLPTAVATSTARDLAVRMLSSFDLLPRFRVVFTGTDVVHGKPHPEIYHKTCAALGVEPRRTLVLEDSYNGVVAAADAGCRVAAVPHEHSRSFDFSRAERVVDGLDDPRLWEFAGL